MKGPVVGGQNKWVRESPILQGKLEIAIKHVSNAIAAHNDNDGYNMLRYSWSHSPKEYPGGCFTSIEIITEEYINLINELIFFNLVQAFLLENSLAIPQAMCPRIN